VASENSGGSKSKIVNANIRENRVVSTSKESPTFTGPVKSNTKMSVEEKNVRDALAAVEADTGIEQALAILAGAKGSSIVKTEDGNPSVIISGSPVMALKTIYATPPAPILPVTVSLPPPPIKTATLDIILFDEDTVTTDGMFDQIFENIGGQELISITRSDIVNGQKISYQPIKNLSAIQQRYNPNNILSLQQTADKFFAGFSIKLENKIPETGNGTNGENVYLNATGDLIIEFININPDEQIETQISVSGTIYEADLGDYTS
jgi:hypothetical protein